MPAEPGDERVEIVALKLADFVGGTDALTTYWSHAVPSEVRFAVICRKLEQAGWTFRRVSGSHHVFTKSGCRPVVIPVHRNKVKPVYAEKAEKICREGGSGSRGESPI